MRHPVPPLMAWLARSKVLPGHPACLECQGVHLLEVGVRDALETLRRRSFRASSSTAERPAACRRVPWCSPPGNGAAAAPTAGGNAARWARWARPCCRIPTAGVRSAAPAAAAPADGTWHATDGSAWRHACAWGTGATGLCPDAAAAADSTAAPATAARAAGSTGRPTSRRYAWHGSAHDGRAHAAAASATAAAAGAAVSRGGASAHAAHDGRWSASAADAPAAAAAAGRRLSRHAAAWTCSAAADGWAPLNAGHDAASAAAAAAEAAGDDGRAAAAAYGPAPGAAGDDGWHAGAAAAAAAAAAPWHVDADDGRVRRLWHGECKRCRSCVGQPSASE